MALPGAAEHVQGTRACPQHVPAHDCEELLPLCDEDHEFGHLMTQKVAQVIRDRLRDMRIESLSRVAI